MKQKAPQKKKYLEFVLMTEDEHRILVEQLGQETAADLIEQLDDYLGQSEKNRRKYDSHYRTIRIWARRSGKTNSTRSEKSDEKRLAARFITQLREHAAWPDMSPRDRRIVYAVLQSYKLPWPALRQRLIEDPAIEAEIRERYRAAVQSQN